MNIMVFESDDGAQSLKIFAHSSPTRRTEEYCLMNLSFNCSSSINKKRASHHASGIKDLLPPLQPYRQTMYIVLLLLASSSRSSCVSPSSLSTSTENTTSIENSAKCVHTEEAEDATSPRRQGK
ncbi:hypothetical protein LIA77_01454 [Sarocladium implicatum]|nr:hypothetical protein LIA77_01454 [Sarocladium implicatum]